MQGVGGIESQGNAHNRIASIAINLKLQYMLV